MLTRWFKQYTNQTDDSDVTKLEEYFMQHSPFPQISVIMSITTGITGHGNVNCYTAIE